MSVAIVMGSDSDLDIVSKAFGVLDDFGVSYTKNVFSAHRTPDKVLELIKSSEENGVEVLTLTEHVTLLPFEEEGHDDEDEHEHEEEEEVFEMIETFTEDEEKPKEEKTTSELLQEGFKQEQSDQ